VEGAGGDRPGGRGVGEGAPAGRRGVTEPAPDPVDWALAVRVANRIAGTDPFARSYHADSLGPDFVELTEQAEALVAEETGLRSLAGPARARVTDRPGWVQANVASFRRLLRPLTETLGAKLQGPMAPVARRAAGAEVGALLGWMSGRVLGQYDLLVVDDEDPEDQDVVYYVGPNVLALERRFAFPPREFRLWLALHEVTHRAQFTGIPWMRAHFLELVHDTLSGVDADSKRLLDALRRAIVAARAGRNPLDDGGIAALLATPAQREALDRMGGLMSLLEGHGDVTMGRAGADLVPSADRFARVLRQRRGQARPLAKLVQQLVGLDAKLRQYEQGERFIEAVEDVGGATLLTRAFEAPVMLPTLEEIRAPGRWIDRVAAAPTPS
jgi:coenzyme F420 biosynthesis associated uncharacterized protein